MWPSYFALTKDAVSISEGYCMAENVSVPHITLCKFGVQAAADVDAVWLAIKDITPPQVFFESLDIMNDPEEHKWAMLMNRKDGIMDFRERVMAAIEKNGGEPEKDGSYDPHLTLVRSSQDKEMLLSVLGDVRPFLQREFDFSLAIGTAIPGGQVSELVKAAPPAPAAVSSARTPHRRGAF